MIRTFTSPCYLAGVSLAVCLLTTTPCTAAEAAWSGFQNGGKMSFDKIDGLPVEWSDETGVAWTVSLEGYGQSSPVVDGDLIYVTSTSGKMKENLHVHAYSRATGKELWKHQAKNATPYENTSYVSRAAPTPVCDKDGVIAFFEGGNVMALSREGKPRWSRNLTEDEGAVSARHGLAASLEQNDKHVFVWVEREKQPYIVALKKADGEVTWKSDGLGVTSWSSPRLVPVSDSESHLVLSGIGKLVGLDPATGKKLWDFADISGNSTPTPIPLGDGKFLIGATVGRGEAGGGNAAASNGVLQITARGDKYRVKYLWQAKRATSSFGSPLAHNGMAYFVNRSGVVYCLDLKSGEEKYAERGGGSIWATPVGVGDKVYLFGKDGVTTVIKDGAEFKTVATNTLWKAEAGGGRFSGPVLYAAAVADSDIVLRRGDKLYCVRSAETP